MSASQERFSSALHNTSRSWRQAVDRRLRDLGVSQASWMTIAIVAKANRSLSQTELADRLGIEDPTMVTMIDRLVKADLVMRVPSDLDRRVKLVTLTETGRTLYGKVKVEADAFRAEVLKNVDEKKLRIATELLEALQAVIESAI
jgi:MarR family transcriptional regulator for hemolysin